MEILISKVAASGRKQPPENNFVQEKTWNYYNRNLLK